MRPLFLLLTALFVALYAQAEVKFYSVAIGTSKSLPVTVTFPKAATLGTIAVHTQGIENLDFTLTSAGTCNPGQSYPAKATCTVEVTFTPKNPGIRYGAVVLLDSSSTQNEIATAYIHGTGQGPQLAIDTGNPYSYFQCLNDYAFHLALDGSGHIYAYDGQLYQVLLSADHQTCSLSAPISVPNAANSGIALDGAGNIYATATHAIEKLIPATQNTFTATPAVTGLLNPTAVAVDGAGNLYVAEQGTYPTPASVDKFTLQQNGTYQKSTLGSGFIQPTGIAVDKPGNVYVADSGQPYAFKETLTGSTYTQSVLGTFAPYTSNIAVDPVDNIYVVQDYDYPFQEGGHTITKLVPQLNGTYAQYNFGKFLSPESIAFDANGNAVTYDSDGFALSEYPFNDPQPVTFASTTNGTASPDSPRTVTLFNSGNAPLDLALLTYPKDFPESPSIPTDCHTRALIQPGLTCTLIINFKPVTSLNGSTTPLPLNEDLTLQSNSLNQSADQQSLPLSSTEIAPNAAVPVITPAGNIYTTPQTVTITDSTPGATIYYTVNGNYPTTSSSVYTGPFTVSQAENVFAIAAAPGYLPGSAAQADYFLEPAQPGFNPHGGTYPSPIKVTLFDSTPGAIIHYTLDGSYPTYQSPIYTAPIPISKSTTIWAIAGKDGWYFCAPSRGIYTILTPTLTTTPGSLAFPASRVGVAAASQTITLKNIGANLITFGTLVFTGANTKSFVLSANGCGASLAPSASCTVGIAFDPAKIGSLSATLSISSDAPGSPQLVALTGTGN